MQDELRQIALNALGYFDSGPEAIEVGGIIDSIYLLGYEEGRNQATIEISDLLIPFIGGEDSDDSG